MKDIRFGIIGCGDVTEKKSGPAFKKVNGSDLVMVMRRDETKLIDYAKRHHIKNYTTDYKALIQSDDVDAVYIATPPKWHHYYTLEAAKHGKAVYVEKPMALTSKECEEMVTTCKKYKVPLYVAYYRRGHEKFRKVSEFINNGTLGNIRSFHYSYTEFEPENKDNRAWLLSEEESGGGLLYDVGSHMMDILLFLFGSVITVKGVSNNQAKTHQVEDVTSGLLVFNSGVQGTVQLTFNGGQKEDQLRIIGDKGHIDLSIMSNDPIQITIEGTTTTIPFEAMEHVQQPFIQEVVNSLHGLNDMDTTGIAGLRTQEVIESLKG